MELVAEDIMKVEEYARYTYSVPQSGFSQWSNITIAMRAKRESRQEAVLTYFGRGGPMRFLLSYAHKSRVSGHETDMLRSDLDWNTHNSVSRKSVWRGGDSNPQMMDQAENLNQTVKTLHFVLVNELGPCGGEQYEGLGEELDEEGHFLPLPPESKSVRYASGDETEMSLLDNRASLPSLCPSGPTGLDSEDNQADGDFWEDKRDRKDGGSDEWTHPHGSEGDGDPSENEENGIYEFCGLNCG
ncbi:hypothetical protein B0H14DRAFT_2673558 [Mycena olivaceomarginata]|nr:hypothetical protein B0H14DRAFT_2673558 [Mycena olivaceomarginata]